MIEPYNDTLLLFIFRLYACALYLHLLRIAENELAQSHDRLRTLPFCCAVFFDECNDDDDGPIAFSATCIDTC